jgi:AcrR family transcriptional regulator
MSELGYEQTSIEGIARRAGVGKQTIYRWWPSKGAIALEALDESLGTVVDFQDTGDIREDLRHHMSGATEMLASSKIGALMQGLIAAAQSDPALSRAYHDKVVEPANDFWLARIAQAQASGEIRADTDAQAIIDMLFGAMYYRLMLHTRPLETQQIDDALHVAFSGLHRNADDAPRPAAASSSAA